MIYNEKCEVLSWFCSFDLYFISPSVPTTAFSLQSDSHWREDSSFPSLTLLPLPSKIPCSLEALSCLGNLSSSTRSYSFQSLTALLLSKFLSPLSACSLRQFSPVGLAWVCLISCQYFECYGPLVFLWLHFSLPFVACVFAFLDWWKNIGRREASKPDHSNSLSTPSLKLGLVAVFTAPLFRKQSRAWNLGLCLFQLSFSKNMVCPTIVSRVSVGFTSCPDCSKKKNLQCFQ